MGKLKEKLASWIGAWVWQKTGRKLLERAVRAGLALLAGWGLSEWGVAVDPDILTALLWLKLEALADWLKHRKP
mgnify:FL=1